MEKNTSLSESYKAPKEVDLTDSSKGGAGTFALTVLAVGIGLTVIGMFFMDIYASEDGSLWFYVLGLGIGALGVLVLLIWALGMFVWSIDAT
ncbi:MAG TPA: hypothetical protein EYQ70_00935 [Marine Group III euryarchaeote]|uniref:Uncharacterized protein n=1 Tax=Marine Group III euryarchaeote TaxID=2173149 RepID=A0A7J4GQQ2_9ARCH|nr:hypothetical protein [Marine Group III euryarchaeote]